MNIKSLIESELPVEIIAESINYDLNILALDLIVGIQGDMVIEDNKVWIFTDSLEHADRIINTAQYDSRFVSKSNDLQILSKNSSQKREEQIDSSVKILLTDELSDSQIAFYKYYPIDKHFYLKEEYTNFW